MHEVINDIKKEIKNNEPLILATSGGPDSMCLLNLLLSLKDEKKLNIICAHVNHNLRKESKEEAEMVKNFCLSNNITYEYTEINGYKGNTENYARQKRYTFFENLIKKYNAKYLLTAHHGDDLMETILMRLSRGTSLDGFKGFSRISKRENYIVYRPLIHVTKDEILNYVKENDIPYAIDKTNSEDKYTRNRFRKYILPPLKNENKEVHRNFLKLSETLEAYDNHINKEIKKLLPIIYKNNKLNVELFNQNDRIIKQKILYNILDKIYKENINLIKDKHINFILELLENKRPNIKLDLPQNKMFNKSYNEAYITEKTEEKEYNFIFEDELKLPNNHIIKKIEDTKEKSNYVIKLNSKDISLPLHIRSRKEGDKIYIKGLNGSKKVKDIFINEKIPNRERKLYPIVTDNKNNILWLPGLKKSKFDRANTQNYDIIIKYF